MTRTSEAASVTPRAAHATKLLVFDTETGGLDPDSHSLLSLGAVVWKDGAIEGEIELLIAEPCLRITRKAMEVNRIDLLVHWREALSPDEAMARLRAFLSAHFRDEIDAGTKVAVAGHNVGFDVGFLKRLCRDTGTDYESIFSHRSLDTAAVIRFLSIAGMLPLASAGADDAFAYFGIAVPRGDRHTALGDARATAQLLTCLIATVSAHAATDPPRASAAQGPSDASWPSRIRALIRRLLWLRDSPASPRRRGSARL